MSYSFFRSLHGPCTNYTLKIRELWCIQFPVVVVIDGGKHFNNIAGPDSLLFEGDR
jgi:hypothetical protein